MAAAGIFIADACAIAAFFGVGDQAMTPRGLAAMKTGVRVSPFTVWELTRKASLGKLPGLPSLGGSFSRRLEQAGYIPHTLSWEDAELSNQLPPHHKDPMDRMLIATAMRNDLIVVTNDRLFAAYGVSMVW